MVKLPTNEKKKYNKECNYEEIFSSVSRSRLVPRVC